MDVNNLKDQNRRGDHLYSDLFGLQTADGQPKSPIKKRAEELATSSKIGVKDYSAYNTKGQKYNNLSSSLDKH